MAQAIPRCFRALSSDLNQAEQPHGGFPLTSWLVDLNRDFSFTLSNFVLLNNF